MKNKFSIAAVSGALVFAGVIWYVASSKPEAASDTAIEQAFNAGFVAPEVTAPEPGTTVAPGSPVNLPAATIPKGYRMYINTNYHFSLAHPPELKAQEFSEGGGAMTITFEDASGEKSFQIFVTPYSSSGITKERFKLDVPSGVIKEPVEIVIDGVRATMFLSSNIAMGETREVWFIKNGYLYEVTTYADLDSWIAEIMATFKFK